MEWYWWVVIGIGTYLFASFTIATWYIMSPVMKPRRWIDYFCYPAGLVILLLAYLTGRIK
ncbi:MAG: hypothetical protein WC919_06145 [Candidatus Paceibacterota bacterium]